MKTFQRIMALCLSLLLVILPLTGGLAEETSAPRKTETVYVFTDASGLTRRILVRDWMTNPEGLETLPDVSRLTALENLSGEGSYVQQEDGSLLWSAEGKDLYYQGEGQEEPPVTLKISYTLEGQPIQPEALAGKSGRVTMTFAYDNALAPSPENPEAGWVPFAALTAVLLENSRFAQVEVTGGILVNDGDRTLVVGACLPGCPYAGELGALSQPLCISGEVQDFALGSAYALVSNALPERLDEDTLEQWTEEAEKQLSQVQTAVTALLEGADALDGGMAELAEKSETLKAGIDALATGASQASQGAERLHTGTVELNLGLGMLQSGLNRLTENSADLSQGATQVFESLLAQVNAQLAAAGLAGEPLTIDTYAQALDGLGASLTEEDIRNQAYQAAYAQVEAAVREREDEIRAQVTQAAEEQVWEAVLSQALGLTRAQYEAGIKAGKVDEKTQAQVESGVEAQLASAQVQQAIQVNIQTQVQQIAQQQMEDQTIQAKLDAAVAEALPGVEALAEAKAQLDGYNAFYEGLMAYTAGVDTAAAGGSTLVEGAKALADGAKSLNEGVQSLAQGATAIQAGGETLLAGEAQLSSGTSELAQGLHQFDQEAVQKIAGLFGQDMEGLSAQVKNALEAARQYGSYAGAAKGMESSVRFLYRTDAIGE